MPSVKMEERSGIQVYEEDHLKVFNADASELYSTWEAPDVIVSDGAYGISGFEGDTSTVEGLVEWYGSHIRAWSEHSSPGTTLWFWNTEIGWATVHPLLDEMGWEYKRCNVWNKGIGHIAGNSNTQRAQTFPAVTEVCVHYVKRPTFEVDGEELSLQDWLRHEWKRSGLYFYEANDACDVSNAATRKYLTACHLWYPPPSEAFSKLVSYANREGEEDGRPYFSRDGESAMTMNEYESLFPKFDCEVGWTNVWDNPSLRSKERIRDAEGGKALHLNQKPLNLIDLIIRTSTDPGDMVWEPFGGLCTAVVSASRLDRRATAAEIDSDVFEYAIDRLEKRLEVAEGGDGEKHQDDSKVLTQDLFK